MRIDLETSYIFRFIKFLIRLYKTVSLNVLRFFQENPYVLLIGFIIKLSIYKVLCLISKSDFVSMDSGTLPAALRDSRTIAKIKRIIPRVENFSNNSAFINLKNSCSFRVAKRFEGAFKGNCSLMFGLFLIFLVVTNSYFMIIFKTIPNVNGIIFRIILLIIGIALIKKKGFEPWLYNSVFYKLFIKFKKIDEENKRS